MAKAASLNGCHGWSGARYAKRVTSRANRRLAREAIRAFVSIDRDVAIAKTAIKGYYS